MLALPCRPTSATALAASRPAAVVLDAGQANADALALLDALRKIAPALAERTVLLSTGAFGRDQLTDPSGVGVSAVLEQPFDADALLSAVRRVAATVD